jgi:elongation factor P--(R)-beta-lysine ligase
MYREEASRLARIKPKLECRAKMMDGIRAYFYRQEFLEVETPLLTPVIAPERFISPYTSEGWFLSTSPELQMKRLLSAGYEKIFQIAHCFRKEERGRQHNPEFTMLEWYRSKADYGQIIDDTEKMVSGISDQLGRGTSLVFQGQEINLALPWPRITVREAYLKWAGWDPVRSFDSLRFDLDMVDKVIPNLPISRPMVLLDYPRECASLARLKAGNPEEAERVEIFLGGLEIANGFSELNDPAEQEKRFKEEIVEIQRQGRPAAMPQKFLESLALLPESAGMALGVDRLAMLFCDAGSIDEVIAFPSHLV